MKHGRSYFVPDPRDIVDISRSSIQRTVSQTFTKNAVFLQRHSDQRRRLVKFCYTVEMAVGGVLVNQ